MKVMKAIVQSLSVLALVMSGVAAVSAAPVMSAPQALQANRVVTGVVLDMMRAAIVGARVTAISMAQHPEVSTVTDGRGEFALRLLPGRYVVLVSAPGFAVAEREVDLTTQPDALAELVLQVAGVAESVKVTAPQSYQVEATRTATKTQTLLRDVPQSITVVTRELVRDQMMQGVGDALRYVPGVMVQQGENNRDQVVLRGNSSSADFFLDGVRDDVQYFRDVYNLDRVETLLGPNAMVFGRGGAGGVVNRVSKAASFRPVREVNVQTGAFGRKRVTAGASQALGSRAAVRVDGLAEDSDSFRDFVSGQRFGVTPTATIVPDAHTTVTLRYEFLHDNRTGDRGITAFANRPADVAPSTFYGNPDDSYARSTVHLVSGTVERRFGGLTLRNHTLAGAYDREYRNYVPGAVNPGKTQVALSAYDTATGRTNLFNQTDLMLVRTTGRLRHTLLAGAEFGRQLTGNIRTTGFFGNTATSISVPYASPTTAAPITFRQSATDGDNHVTANVAGLYAQDQVEVSSRLQVLGGVRLDRFALSHLDRRNGETRVRPDTFVSPRAGVVFKPAATASLYGSVGVSFLPSAGDQFASLTSVTEQLKPEQFRNYEVGAKWDTPAGVSLTTAVYRLDRTNTRSTDPNDPTRIVQTGTQRSAGWEVGANGRVTRRWSVAGGYAFQTATVTRATAAAPEGARVGQVPRHMTSLWNNVQVTGRLSAALGLVQRSEMFAAIDNTVRLPGYLRADAAAFVTLSPALRLQLNVENLLNASYIINAHSNTNLSPGSPRAVRFGLVVTF